MTVNQPTNHTSLLFSANHLKSLRSKEGTKASSFSFLLAYLLACRSTGKRGRASRRVWKSRIELNLRTITGLIHSNWRETPQRHITNDRYWTHTHTEVITIPMFCSMLFKFLACRWSCHCRLTHSRPSLGFDPAEHPQEQRRRRRLRQQQQQRGGLVHGD